MSSTRESCEPISIRGIDVELRVKGRGQPLLFLHAGGGVEESEELINLLANRFEVFAPSHPGFGATPISADLKTVDDLSYFYLDVLDALDRDFIVVGASFGAWLAAQIAIKSLERISKIVFVAPAGIKTGDRLDRDFVDLFRFTPQEWPSLLLKNGRPHDFGELPEAQLVRVLRNSDAMTRFAWAPYMHDPNLRSRLYRIRRPSLVVCGRDDRFSNSGYARAFSDALPQSTFATIDDAGHLAHADQPAAVSRLIEDFALGQTGVFGSKKVGAAS